MSKWFYFFFVIGLIALAIFIENRVVLFNPVLFFILLLIIDLGDMGKINFIKKLDDKIVSCISSIFNNFGGLICKSVLFAILIFFIISYILYFFHATDSCCYWGWIRNHYQFVNNSNFGQIGDIIGGLMTPVLTAITLYFAYKTYKEESHYAKEELNNASKTYQKEGFEKIFYSYLEQNRNLCAEIKQNTKQKSFEKMYDEFQDIYCQALICYLEKNRDKYIDKLKDYYASKPLYNCLEICELKSKLDEYQKQLEKEDIIKLVKFSYELFYYGNERVKGKYYKKGSNDLDKFIDNTSNYKAKNEFLGIYYRNLFQCVKFIHKSSFLSKDEKQEYAKILRTSMSDYAQLMLYYNCFSERGKAWIKCDDFNDINLLEHYRMIQNVPKLDVYVGIEPKEQYDIEFEYEKIESNDDFSSVL